MLWAVPIFVVDDQSGGVRERERPLATSHSYVEIGRDRTRYGAKCRPRARLMNTAI
jgi:hypothetical protein